MTQVPADKKSPFTSRIAKAFTVVSNFEPVVLGRAVFNVHVSTSSAILSEWRREDRHFASSAGV